VVGEEGKGSGILKMARSGRNRRKLCNIAQYFAIEKPGRGVRQQKMGREAGLKGTGRGGSNPLPPTPPSSVTLLKRFDCRYSGISIHSFSFIRTIFIRTLTLRFAPKFKKMYGLK